MEKATMKADFHFSAWQGMVELVVATWLIMSPFLLGFFDHTMAGLTAISIGALLIFMTLLGISRHPLWENGFSLTLALLLSLSPWLLHYSSSQPLATWNAVVSGVFIAFFTLLILVRDNSGLHSPQQPMGHGGS
jgi:hypothetical protein